MLRQSLRYEHWNLFPRSFRNVDTQECNAEGRQASGQLW